MASPSGKCEIVRDGFVGELTEAALPVVSRHGVNGFSVDQEIGLWKRFGEVVRRQNWLGGDGHDLPDVLSAELAEAAYSVSLEQGFRGSFVDFELDLWTVLRRVAREGAWARSFWGYLCGKSGSVRGTRLASVGA